MYLLGVYDVIIHEYKDYCHW